MNSSAFTAASSCVMAKALPKDGCGDVHRTRKVSFAASVTGVTKCV